MEQRVGAISRTGHPGATDGAQVLSLLEQQLIRLDEVGAHIAAAHLDAAIHQLRVFLADQAPAL